MYSQHTPKSHNKQVSQSSITSISIPLENLHKPLPAPPSTVTALAAWKRRRGLSGWRVGVSAAATAASCVLLINVILTIHVTVVYGTTNGIGVAYEGDCQVVDSYATWLHIFINIIGSILLAASNYCMQCISAPTREECDRAHARGDWLDIGILSTRNIFKLNRGRVVLWLLLAFSSVPIHLLYNSTVFKTTSANYYKAVIVDEGFLRGEPLILDLQNKWTNGVHYDQPGRYMDMQESWIANGSNYNNLTTQDCVAAYATDFVSEYNDVLLVTHDNATNDGIGRLMYSWILGPEEGDLEIAYGISAPSYAWLCANPDGRDCNTANILANATNYSLHGYKIAYCLAQRPPSHCQLQFSSTLLAIVIVCNLIKAVIMLSILHYQKTPTLVVFGDAVSSFLDRPDENTKHLNALSQRDLKQKSSRTKRSWIATHWQHNMQQSNMAWWKGVFHKIRAETPPRNLEDIHPTWIPSQRRQRWGSAGAKGQWIVFICLSTSCLIAGALLFSMAIGTAESHLSRTSDTSPFGAGFGAMTTQTLISNLFTYFDNTQATMYAILLGNLPQVIMSSVYLLFNALFTAMLLGREWSEYAVRRRPLRVTSPSGLQRSTLWLHMPMLYSLPLLTLSALMHWLISESLFLVRLQTREVSYFSNVAFNSTIGQWTAPSGGPDNPYAGEHLPAQNRLNGSIYDVVFYPNHTHTQSYYQDKIYRTTSVLGYSLSPILTAWLLGLVMLLAIALFSFRKFESNMPVAASCSLAIAAACHPAEYDDSCSVAPLQWGVVAGDDAQSPQYRFTSFAILPNRTDGDKTRVSSILLANIGQGLSSIRQKISLPLHDRYARVAS